MLFATLAASMAHATVYDVDVYISLHDTAPTAFTPADDDYLEGYVKGERISHSSPPAPGTYPSDEMDLLGSDGQSTAFVCVVNDSGKIWAKWIGSFVTTWPTWPTTDPECVITEGGDTWNITINITETTGAPTGVILEDPADREAFYSLSVWQEDP